MYQQASNTLTQRPSRFLSWVLNSKLFSNFVFLGVSQALNYIVPLLSVPYLARVLGPYKLGLLLFSQTFMQYFVTLNDYGFNLSATRKVAAKRRDRSELNRIVSSIYSIKLGFLIVSFLAILLICGFFERFHANLALFLCSFGFVIGTSLTPTWFFLGHENMKPLASINFFAKLIFLLLLVSFVKNESDVVKAAWISSLSQILVAVFSSALLFRAYGIKFERPVLAQLIAELREGWTIFVSTMSSSFYLASNTIILGLLGGESAVGLYSAGEKIVRSIQWTMQPLYQTVFPHIGAMYGQPLERVKKFLGKLFILLVALTLPCSFLLWYFADQICVLLLGAQFAESVRVVRVLAWLPFVCSLGNLLGTQIMINFRMDGLFRRVILINSVLGIGLSYALIKYFGLVGSSWAILIYEIVITLCLLMCVQGSQLRIFGKNSSKE